PVGPRLTKRGGPQAAPRTTESPTQKLAGKRLYQRPLAGQPPFPGAVHLRVTVPFSARSMVNVLPLAAPALAVTVQVVPVPSAALRYAAPFTSAIGIEASTACRAAGALPTLA